jgi:hypothetical protein
VQYLADALQYNTVRLICYEYISRQMYLYRSIKTLSLLDLRHNKISDIGAQYLIEKLQHNHVRLVGYHFPQIVVP